MNVEIITIGDELLIGQVIDTNSAFIARELNRIGIRVFQITSVSDSRRHILAALEEASRRAPLVLITGGLGPTRDDITKSVFAEYTGDRLTVHHETLQRIETMMSVRCIAMNPLNEKQAEVPSRCTVIPNSCGTAPGMWFEKDGVVYVSMPGVPFEMKTMMQDEVLPRLRQRFHGGNILHRTLLVTGIPESALALRIEDWENSLPPHLKLAYLPGGGMIRLRLSAFGDDLQTLAAQTEKEIESLRVILGNHILSEADEQIEEIVARLLTEKRQTVATAESCTGGNIAHLLTSIPGSSVYFKGSVVAYADEIKENILHVNPDDLRRYGAVSEQAVTQMAASVRKLMDTDYGIAASGIAGPAGGTPDKPVGTVWIAVASASQTVTKLLHYGNNRESNIQRTSVAALNLLREMIHH
ncbi:MAG: competence/damage-inducible protein A [Bacteroidales bacterium]|jgi:nicotinamide-nucleotide amidase|nr:competence/damage-inducible protein A [Bacteroidales bacterium]